MSKINFNSKINLPIIGEVDLNDYFIKSIEVLSDADTYYFDGFVGKTVSYNHTVIIKNDYFEFEILYYENRNDKEILYLFDIFKQLTKYEIDFWHYRELQKAIEDRYYGYIYI